MKKLKWIVLLGVLITVCLLCYVRKQEKVRIGVVFGMGSASRWQEELNYMEEYAEEIGIGIETRLNRDEKTKTFEDDCKEVLNQGIDVLIIRARNEYELGDIVSYAHQKNVKIICYSNMIYEEKTDLFVGYDDYYMGKMMGKFLSEYVVDGDYILLSGDVENQKVDDLVYEGAMEHIDPIRDKINIILETGVADWSPDVAKTLVKEAVAKNNGSVDAIYAPNDKLAGACAEALEELEVTKPVCITGMDAELSAVRRIVAGTQSCSIYMNGRQLADTAVDQAVSLAKGEKGSANWNLDNLYGDKIPAVLIPALLVTKENIDKVLIDTGVFGREEVYSPET